MTDLSIIIPHYNSAIQLEKLLLSIPKKDNIQIIVIDDKSNKEMDKLMILQEAPQFNHILFLKNKTNKKGAGICRNIGLEKVKGKWVLFADSDDFFIDDFYLKIESYFTSNYDVIFFKPTSVELGTDKKSDRHIQYENLIKNYYEKSDFKSEARLRYHFFVPWSKLIKVDFIKKNDILFDGVIASNDVMFSTKVGYHMKNFYVEKEVIYCVTKGTGTLTTTRSPNIYDARLNVFIEYYKFIHGNLKKEELKVIYLSGTGLLIEALRQNMGFKKMFSACSKLRKNKVRIFDKRILNPVFVSNKCIKLFKAYLKHKNLKD